MNSTQEKKIAIIIPAYKTEFLRQTLESIASQTCRNFSVYLGDDCSPYDIDAIVGEFSTKMDLHYVRFESNVGGKDLVAQWERCIALAGDEQWIWLFSDDDMLPADGIERVQDAISGNPDENFFRLPLQVIDGKGNVIIAHTEFCRERSTAEDYLTDYFSGRRSSAACEYIFNRKLFNTLGMVHFPCAWCADIATWYSYASRNGGITNLNGLPVSWRNAEGVNISSTNGLYVQKMDALIQFIAWLKKNHGLPFSKSLKDATEKYIGTILSVSLNRHYSAKDLRRLTGEFLEISAGRALKTYCKYIFKNRI